MAACAETVIPGPDSFPRHDQMVRPFYILKWNVLGPGDLRWQLFYAWLDGRQPPHIPQGLEFKCDI